MGIVRIYRRDPRPTSEFKDAHYINLDMDKAVTFYDEEADKIRVYSGFQFSIEQDRQEWDEERIKMAEARKGKR